MEPQNITAEYIGNFFKPAPDEAQRVFAKLERNEIGRNPKIVGAFSNRFMVRFQ